MKSFRQFLVIGAMMLALTVVAGAEEKSSDTKSEAPKQLKNQTHCPVMGGKIDSTVYTDIQGQRVYHCCPMCSGKLKADPDTFFKKAAAEGVLFENIQTSCPVSGEKLQQKSIYTDYEGRRVYFCCSECREPFDKDPQKYFKRLDQTDSEASDEKPSSGGHDGHNH